MLTAPSSPWPRLALIGALVTGASGCSGGETREPKLPSDARIAYSEYRIKDGTAFTSDQKFGTFELREGCLSLTLSRPRQDSRTGPFVAVFHEGAATIEDTTLHYVEIREGRPEKAVQHSLRLGIETDLPAYIGLYEASEVAKLKLPAACGNLKDVAVFHNYPLYKK